MTLEDYLKRLDAPIRDWHDKHIALFHRAKGSSHNHQAWPGGYYDHLLQCFCLAERLYSVLTTHFTALPFTLESALKILYFHDVEKLFKYTTGLPAGWDKEKYLYHELADTYGICFSPEERNALTYIHGEGDDYRKDRRVMNEPAGFCHAVDVLSARVLHDVRCRPGRKA